MPSSPLFKEWKIRKIKDIEEIQNCLLSHSFLKGKLPKSFENFYPNLMFWFNGVTYNINFITNASIYPWNKLAEVVDKPSSLSTN